MSEQPNLQKKSTSSRFFGSVGRGFKTMGKKMSSGVAKAKQMSYEKMGGKPTPEDPDILKALEKIKTTKEETVLLANNARGLYESYLQQMRNKTAISEAIKLMRVEKGDDYGQTLKSMEPVMSTIVSEDDQYYVKSLLNNFVLPLETFRDKNLEGLRVLKNSYKVIKAEYDYAVHQAQKVTKEQNTTQQKINQANQKRDKKKVELEEHRQKLKDAILEMEAYKKTTLNNSLNLYWKDYVQYASRVNSRLLNKKPINTQMISNFHNQNPPTIPNNNNNTTTISTDNNNNNNITNCITNDYTSNNNNNNNDNYNNDNNNYTSNNNNNNYDTTNPFSDNNNMVDYTNISTNNDPVEVDEPPPYNEN